MGYAAGFAARVAMRDARAQESPVTQVRMELQASIDAYFEIVSKDEHSGLYQIELNLLGRVAVQSLTETFSFHPLVRDLDGLVLDDPNTSNHHILLRRHPFEGHVLYLAHDGNSKIVFPSLADFLCAADAAKASGQLLSELHPLVSPHEMDQKAVSHLVRSLVQGTDEGVSVALALIPSMDLSDIDLLAELVQHEDFFVGEAVGEAIAQRPSSVLREVALLCSKHPHPQAARAGAKALLAIGGVSSRSSV